MNIDAKKVLSLLLVTALLVGVFEAPNLKPAHANFGICGFSLDTYSGDAPLSVTLYNINITVGGTDYNSGNIAFSIAVDGQWSDYVTEPVQGPIAQAPDKTVILDQPGDHTIQLRCKHSSGQTIDSGITTVTVTSSSSSPSSTPSQPPSKPPLQLPPQTNIGNFDFELHVSNTVLKVTPGGTIDTVVAVNLLEGEPAPVTLSVKGASGLGNYVKVSADQNNEYPSFTSRLTFATSQGIPSGTYIITILAQGGAVSHTITVDLVVAQQEKIVKMPPIQTSVACPSRAAQNYGLPQNNYKTSDYNVWRVYRWDNSVKTVPQDYNLNNGTDRFMRQHKGVDYSSLDANGNPAYLPFKAGVTGKAYIVKNSPWNTINVVLNNGVIVQYLHASKILVKDNDQVTPDTVLGMTGNTATSDLHLPIHLHVQAKDPKGHYLNPNCLGGK